MFNLTHTLKADQTGNIARKVRRGWLIAIIVLVVAFVAMGFVAQLNADDPGPSVSAPALTG